MSVPPFAFGRQGLGYPARSPFGDGPAVLVSCGEDAESDAGAERPVEEAEGVGRDPAEESPGFFGREKLRQQRRRGECGCAEAGEASGVPWYA